MGAKKHSGVTDLQTLLMMLTVTQRETGHAILFASDSKETLKFKKVKCSVHGVNEKDFETMQTLKLLIHSFRCLRSPELWKKALLNVQIMRTMQSSNLL